MVLCPNGHSSEWDDYCGVCGAPIAAGGAAQAATPSVPLTPGVASAEQLCPACAEPREIGEPFCEACGHDFSVAVAPTNADATPAVALLGIAQLGIAQPGAVQFGTAVIAADRAYFDQHSGTGSLRFPEPAPAAFEIVLTREIVLIGRRSDSRNILPDVDLSGVYDDPAVSHRHAELRHTEAGWVVVDLGSTNGTRLSPSGPVVAPQAAVPVTGPIYLGAWTSIRLSGPASS